MLPVFHCVCCVAAAGDVAYLVSTTHPDSSLALGGSRDLASRTRSQAATFKENKVCEAVDAWTA